MKEDTLLKKLNNIQSELKAPKGQYNSFGKYKYRSCEDIFNAVKPLLTKYELVLQTTDELINVGDRYYIKATATLTDMDGSSISNTSYAREEDTKKGMDGSQITGASSSYARKYALNGLFLIDDTKDSDTTNVGNEITAETFTFYNGKHRGKTIEEVAKEDSKYLEWYLENGRNNEVKTMITKVTGLKPIEIPPEEEQQERLRLIVMINDLVNQTNTDYDELLKYYGVESNSEMTIEQLKDAVEKLRSKNG